MGTSGKTQKREYLDKPTLYATIPTNAGGNFGLINQSVRDRKFLRVRAASSDRLRPGSGPESVGVSATIGSDVMRAASRHRTWGVMANKAGLAALRWIAAGYGYEITGLDVLSAYSGTIEAAKNCSAVDEVEGRIRELLAAPTSASKEFMAKVLERSLAVR